MNNKNRRVIGNRINEKIENIEKYLRHLNELNIPEFEDYKNDFKTKAVCERLFEIIIEDIISIAFLIIREKKLTLPENEEHAFTILSNNKILNPELAIRLKQAKDMRNRIVHNYITIDDEIVYNAITEELPKDAEEFLNEIAGRK